jgi:hypothetical protein
MRWEYVNKKPAANLMRSRKQLMKKFSDDSGGNSDEEED